MIHILMYGRSYCGMQGTPNMWPPGHVWIVPSDMAKTKEDTRGHSFCCQCLSVYDEEVKNRKEDKLHPYCTRPKRKVEQ